MPILYRQFPDKVLSVSGPLITLPRPIQVRDIGAVIADEKYCSNASSRDEIGFIQLLAERDRTGPDMALCLTVKGGESRAPLYGFDYGRTVPLSDSVVLNSDGKRDPQAVARFADLLNVIDERSAAVVKAFGGAMDETTRRVALRLTSDGPIIKCDGAGNRLDARAAQMEDCTKSMLKAHHAWGMDTGAPLGDAAASAKRLWSAPCVLA